VKPRGNVALVQHHLLLLLRLQKMKHIDKPIYHNQKEEINIE